MKVLAAIGFVLALAVTPAFAGDLEDGTRFLKNKDYSKAASSFRKAAEQGDANAQLNLGSMYADGKGVTRDYKLAILWFQKAAAQGNATAQLSLGSMYEEGNGVAKDYKQAAFWFEKAAAQGNSIAMFMLYSLYSEGVAKDTVEAHKWATITSLRGNPSVGELRKLQEMEMTREQIGEAQRRAVEWLKAHK